MMERIDKIMEEYDELLSLNELVNCKNSKVINIIMGKENFLEDYLIIFDNGYMLHISNQAYYPYQTLYKKKGI